MTPREAWLWLAAALGPAASNAGEVLRALEEMDDAPLRGGPFPRALLNLLTPRQRQALARTKPADLAPLLARCRELDIRVTCWDEEEYPALLRQIPSPPPVLYWRGDIALAEGFTIAIIGTRRPSAYGVEATAKIAGDLTQAGAVLVSGMADGLDSEGHKAALRAGTPTIACIAFGHDHCYPAANRQLKELIERHGLVIGEYPPGTEPQPHFFLQRNRLIAGLSKGVCVAEARRRSGTMSTAHLALDWNREVFSVPGNIFSPLCEGTNRLLQEGAYPATCGADILIRFNLFEEMAPAEGQAPGPCPDVPLTAEAKAMRGALTFAPQGLDALCAATGLAPGQAMAALTCLELAGISRQLAGRQFVLK